MQLVIQWIISALTIMLAAAVLPGVTAGFGASLLAAVIISLVTVFIKPLLLFLSLPLNILTFGLFSLVVNGIVIMIASALTPGFKVSGLGSAILFAVVLSLVNIIFFSIAGGW